MRSITYLILGVLVTFILIVAVAAQPSVSTLAGIVMGGLCLAFIPFIIYWMRHVHKRDEKHEE
jgi:Ca2+/Na+ antiporter